MHCTSPSSSGVPTSSLNANHSQETIFPSFVSGIWIVFSSNTDLILFGIKGVASYSTSLMLISVSSILRSLETPASISSGIFQAMSFLTFSGVLAYCIEQDQRYFSSSINSSILSSFQRCFLRFSKV